MTTGDYVMCAGQVGIADHVHLGTRSVIGAKPGVHKDVPAGERQIGVPAIPEADCQRVVMAQHKLPEMRQQLEPWSGTSSNSRPDWPNSYRRAPSPRTLIAKRPDSSKRPDISSMTTLSTSLSKRPVQRIGLLAGAGRFPIAFAEAARKQGHSVFGVGVVGMASDELHNACDYFTTTSLGRFGRAIRFFKSARIDRVVMAGKVDKTVLFHPYRWIRHLPDFRAIHMMLRYARENRKDDTLMLALIRRIRARRPRFRHASQLLSGAARETRISHAA